MTLGYICDLCGQFNDRTATPAATYEHRALFTDEHGNELNSGKRFQVEAHFCDECAIDLSRRFHIYPGQEEPTNAED